jgi:hypothetical protein
MSRTAKDSVAAAVMGGMDKIASVTEIALGGIRASLERLHRAAHAVATAGVEGRDPIELAEPLVRALEAQRALEASAAVLRRADDAFDSLLDALG